MHMSIFASRVIAVVVSEFDGREEAGHAPDRLGARGQHPRVESDHGRPAVRDGEVALGVLVRRRGRVDRLPPHDGVRPVTPGRLDSAGRGHAPVQRHVGARRVAASDNPAAGKVVHGLREYGARSSPHWT